MYGGGNTFEATKFDNLAKEDPVKLGEFEARIARGEKIEPGVTTARTGVMVHSITLM